MQLRWIVILLSIRWVFVASSITDSSIDYKNACSESANQQEAFLHFRSNPKYIGNLGEPYPHIAKNIYSNLIANSSQMMNFFHHFMPLEKIGGPHLIQFSETIVCSSALLRYVAIASDINQQFNSLNGKKIIEIGAGFGGQCFVLSTLFPTADFILVDIPEALALQKKVLHLLGMKNVTYLTPQEVESGEGITSDFVISNYAFSECNKQMQQIYLDKIISHSKSGYMISNQTAGFFRIENFSQCEIYDYISSRVCTCQIMPEFFPTFEGNYTMVWKSGE